MLRNTSCLAHQAARVSVDRSLLSVGQRLVWQSRLPILQVHISVSSSPFSGGLDVLSPTDTLRGFSESPVTYMSTGRENNLYPTDLSATGRGERPPSLVTNVLGAPSYRKNSQSALT